MTPAATSSKNETESWSVLQKIAFRFFFVFISLNTWFAYNILNEIFYPRYDKWVGGMMFLARPLYWLDRHFYHIGYKPAQYPKVTLNDRPVGWVLLITIAVLSIVACVLWSIIDKKRKNYSKLNYWFKTYLSWYLFLSMVFYAVYKIMLVQMPFPNARALLEPLGDKSKVDLFFNVVGLSPGYGIFTGICELAAALLILCRRTRALGCLLMAMLLVNVVAVNLFYNVTVKLLSMHLLLVALYLLVPYVPKLVRFFYRMEPVSLAEKQYTFSTPWKKYAMIALLLVPLWVSGYLILRGAELRRTDINRQQQKVFEVITFAKGNDTLSSLLTDTFRIKRVLFTAYYEHKYAVVYDMNDKPTNYEYIRDTSAKKITLLGIAPDKSKAEFDYKELSQKQLKLDGMWLGQHIKMRLKEMNVDSLPIVKEKMIWVQRK